MPVCSVASQLLFQIDDFFLFTKISYTNVHQISIFCCLLVCRLSYKFQIYIFESFLIFLIIYSLMFCINFFFWMFTVRYLSALSYYIYLGREMAKWLEAKLIFKLNKALHFPAFIKAGPGPRWTPGFPTGSHFKYHNISINCRLYNFASKNLASL